MAKEKSNIVLSQEHFAPFIAAKAELDAKIQAEGGKAVSAFLKEYFDKRPDVYGIKWTQYTPHFNDGDACVFSLHSIYTFKTQEAFESDDDLYDNAGAEECYGEEPETSLTQVEELLQASFGDHAQVSVTREKIDVEEYQHD